MQSLIYAAPRTEVKELHTVRQLLGEKFGKEFALAASENRDGKVAARVLERLRVEPPKRELVEAYLSTIAEAYGVDWPAGRKSKDADEDEDGNEDDDDDGDDDNPSGGQKVKALEAPLSTEELSKATPPRRLDQGAGPKSPVSVMPPSPRTDNVAPKVRLPGPLELKPGGKMGRAQEKERESGTATGKGDETEVNVAAAAATAGKKGKEAVGGSIPTADDLAKRFAQLKR